MRNEHNGLDDECNNSNKLPEGPARRGLWQNALKHYARDAIAYAAAAGDETANARMDAERERGRKRRAQESEYI